MFSNRLLQYLFFLVLTSSMCTNTFAKITGVIQSGLDGTLIEGAKVSLLGTEVSTFSNSEGFFSISIPENTEFNTINEKYDNNLSLLVEKNGFKDLKYNLSRKTEGLVIGLIPYPIKLNAGYLLDEQLPYTEYIEKDIVWSNIIDGVRKFHENRLEDLKSKREYYWNRDLSNDKAYNLSVEPNRNKFRNILGAIDQREDVMLEKKGKVSETSKYEINEIRWTVLKEIHPRPPLQVWPELDVPRQIFGEGLLLEPKAESKGFVIAIPDADQEPEDLAGLTNKLDPQSQYGRLLVENGYTVVVPVVIDRTNRWSRGTNRSSRSWIYSQTHELGRTVTGYEVQKMEAIIDWFEKEKKGGKKIAIAGYGEGGLIAFYTSALDTRVDVTLVSGYFAPREEIWKEPIYRNLWGVLKEFGDAEIAALIAPRSLIIEYSNVPFYDGEKNDGEKIDPPGELWTHTFSDVEAEFNRISAIIGDKIGERVLLKKEKNQTLPFGSELAVKTMVEFMGNQHFTPLSEDKPKDLRVNFDYKERMGRMVEQMVGHTQLLLRDSEYVRAEFVEKNKNKDKEELRDFFKEEMVGWTHHDFLPINPRSRKIEDKEKYVCYEVLIDVLPNIEMWGYLLVPKDIGENEKRPAIVFQHGRGGFPHTALDEKSTYYGIARRLAETGYVVFTPFGNWTGETQFRWIDRIAKPAKNSLWSTIGRQHQQLISWFHTIPFIDTDRIGLYGKSIGGQAASLIASMIPEYALSINCAYFNESARKESSVYFPTSFVFHVDSEMPMWNRAHTLEYAEMANMLIFPRPFMVEHGKNDDIAPYGWVEHEYSKVRLYYNEQNKNDFTELDHHEGGHVINGVKTLPFIKKHLQLK